MRPACGKRSNREPELTLTPDTPDIVYVNLLLMKQRRDGQQEKTLTKSTPLESFSVGSTEMSAPPYEVVMDRLKVMCDLDRTQADDIRTGRFRIRAMGETWGVECVFDDLADGRCTLTIAKG